MGQDILAQGRRGEDHCGVPEGGHRAGEGEGILVLDGDEVTTLQVCRQVCLRGRSRIEVGSGQTQPQSPTRKKLNAIEKQTK